MVAFISRWVPPRLMLFGFTQSPMAEALSLYVISLSSSLYVFVGVLLSSLSSLSWIQILNVSCIVSLECRVTPYHVIFQLEKVALQF